MKIIAGEKILTGKELYEMFNESIGFAMAVPFATLPPMYRDAWERLADYCFNKTMVFIGRKGKDDEKKESTGGD